MIEITAVGGYSEVGRNMTAVKYNDEVVLLDMGVHLENYIRFKGDDDLELFNLHELVQAQAVPNTSCIKDWKNVIAIIPSHGHLDHIGAIPYMAAKYNCPIICTPYTASVIKAILKDKKLQIPNDIRILGKNHRFTLSDSITVEFVNITHSIPHTALVVLHTPNGQIIYSNDFKLDNSPTLGDKPNYKRMKELGRGNVKALIIDSLYADHPYKTPSESKAKEKLKEVMLQDSKNKAVIVTTFSSHIARLKSIVEFGKLMKRKILFLGRSLAKYVYAAEDIDLVNFSKSVEIIKYKKQMKKRLQEIEKIGRDKYLIVATGHQGEPNAVLSRIVDNKLGFHLMPEDHVIFSCTTIPSPMNIENRQKLEIKLKKKRVRIFKNIHASGHASREDHREMINMIKPEHLIPSHCGPEKAEYMVELAKELGYTDKTVHVMSDGERIKI
jgi:ribonuclease J